VCSGQHETPAVRAALSCIPGPLQVACAGADWGVQACVRRVLICHFLAFQCLPAGACRAHSSRSTSGSSDQPHGHTACTECGIHTLPLLPPWADLLAAPAAAAGACVRQGPECVHPCLLAASAAGAQAGLPEAAAAYTAEGAAGSGQVGNSKPNTLTNRRCCGACSIRSLVDMDTLVLSGLFTGW
jgi:hypothetical protein